MSEKKAQEFVDGLRAGPRGHQDLWEVFQCVALYLQDAASQDRLSDGERESLTTICEETLQTLTEAPKAERCCPEPRVRDGRCINCGAWVDDLTKTCCFCGKKLKIIQFRDKEVKTVDAGERIASGREIFCCLECKGRIERGPRMKNVLFAERYGTTFSKISKLAKQMDLEDRTGHTFALVCEVLKAREEGRYVRRELNMLEDFIVNYWPSAKE